MYGSHDENEKHEYISATSDRQLVLHEKILYNVKLGIWSDIKRFRL